MNQSEQLQVSEHKPVLQVPDLCYDTVGAVHSYGPLTDSECKKLLDCSIRGTGISGYAYGY